MGRAFAFLVLAAGLVAIIFVLVNRGPDRPRVMGAKVRGEHVRFVFRPRHYRWTVIGGTRDSVAMRDLRVRRVSVVGAFNDWTPGAARLRLDEGTWALRVPLDRVGADAPFTFVVNDRFWVESPPTAANRAPLEGGGMGLQVR